MCKHPSSGTRRLKPGLDSAPCAPGRRSWLIVIPILFLDFLVIAMPRAVIPQLIDERFGEKAYWLLGVAEATKGALAFLMAPAIGALSDVVGRKWLFVVCVLGTASPSWVLALSDDLVVYLVFTAASGAAAGTFPLAFAYIADVVPPKARASAYGLTLGLTLGLSMLVGPMSGALLSRAMGVPAGSMVPDLCAHGQPGGVHTWERNLDERLVTVKEFDQRAARGVEQDLVRFLNGRDMDLDPRRPTSCATDRARPRSRSR